MTTENQPHVVYPRGATRGYIGMFATYADAYAAWKDYHSRRHPFVIATLGRVIDPSVEIVDVNE